MASGSSMPPPPSSGGGAAKYLIGLLILLGGGLGVFLATRGSEPPKPAPAAPPPKVERSTALTNDQLALPEEEEPDAGGPVAEVKKPTKKGPAIDTWSCQGDVPAAEIKQVLSDRQTQIRSCYERRLRVDNLLQGSVNLQVRIGADGKVQATRTRGTMKDKEVLECMENLTKKWTFPPPTGGNCAVFDAPYNFTPKQ